MDKYEVTEIPLDFERTVAITAVELCEGKVYIGLRGAGVALVELDPTDESVRDTGFQFPSKGNDILNKIHNSLVVACGVDGAMAARLCPSRARRAVSSISTMIITSRP